jgi:phytoene dehydrogenase-like protein
MEKSPPVLPSPWRKLSVKNKIRNMARLSRSARAVKKLASLDAIRLMNGSAMDLLDEWFESDVLKATLATDAVIGAHMSPSDAGSAYVLLHHVMGDAGGQRGVWGYVEGGMGGLADSLEKCCINYGVEFVKETEVRQIVVKNSKVEAVLTDNGYFETNVVASSVDANLTFNKLMDVSLPDGFFNAVNRIDYSSASAKVNLALSGPPAFAAAKNRDISCLNGTIHISPSVSYIEDAFEDSKQGKFSRKPVLEITIPSMVDKTIAPEGKHIMSIFVQYAPYKLSGGWNNKNKDALFNTCIETIGNYVSNIKDLILHKQVLTPVDLEKKYCHPSGHISFLNPQGLKLAYEESSP